MMKNSLSGISKITKESDASVAQEDILNGAVLLEHLGLWVKQDGSIFKRLPNGKIKEMNILKLKSTSRTYKFVNHAIDGEQKRFYQHRLIAEAFLPNPHNYKIAELIDGNSDNISLNNIRWVPASYIRAKGSMTYEENSIICKKCGKSYHKSLKSCQICEKNKLNFERRLNKSVEILSHRKKECQLINLKTLRPKTRQYFELYLQGLSITNIANQANTIPSNVSSRISSYVSKSLQDNPLNFGGKISSKVVENGKLVLFEDGSCFKILNNGELVPAIMSTEGESDGYLITAVTRRGKKKIVYLHKLYAKTFIPNPKKYKNVQILDNNPFNIVKENLRWVNQEVPWVEDNLSERVSCPKCKTSYPEDDLCPFCEQNRILFESEENRRKKKVAIRLKKCANINTLLLNNRTKEIFSLYLRGFTYTEIAEKMDSSSQNICNVIRHNIRKQSAA